MISVSRGVGNFRERAHIDATNASMRLAGSSARKSKKGGEFEGFGNFGGARTVSGNSTEGDNFKGVTIYGWASNRTGFVFPP